MRAHRWPDGAAERLRNERTGHQALIHWIGELPIGRVAFEPTGPYHRGLERVPGGGWSAVRQGQPAPGPTLRRSDRQAGQDRSGRCRNARASALTTTLSTRGRGAQGAPSGVTTSFRPPRFVNVSGMWTVIVSPSAETVARVTPPPSGRPAIFTASRPLELEDRASRSSRSQYELSAPDARPTRDGASGYVPWPAGRLG